MREQKTNIASCRSIFPHRDGFHYRFVFLMGIQSILIMPLQACKILKDYLTETMLGGKNSVQGPLFLKLIRWKYFKMECNFLALKQCLHLSQINIKPPCIL